MPSIKDVKDAFETAVSNSDFFQQFVPDDIETINEDSKNSYPYLLLTPISSVKPDPRKKSFHRNYTIELHGCNLQYSGDGEERDTRHDIWEGLEDNIDLLITSLDDSVRLGDGDISYEYGYAQHNDEVVVVKATVNILVFGC
jgi:hypothetical protein